MDYYQLIQSPVITEKTVNARAQHVYVFKVNPLANKIMVRQAVEKVFKVKVVAVNTVTNHGKPRRAGNKAGKTARYKKAYVTLKEGSKIEELEV